MTIWDDPNPKPWEVHDDREDVEGQASVAPPEMAPPLPPPPPPAPMFDEPSTPPAWSHEQLQRLENEWRRLQRSFAYHPHIRVAPLQGDPPEQYQVEYRIRCLTMDGAGQLQYANMAAVHVWLPPGFPHEPPLLRPLANLFHPNVVPDGINVDRYWTSTRSTLSDVIIGVGAMLCYQDYDLENAWNHTAAEWVIANPRMLPLDPDAEFRPEAGGDPLSRICRHGPRTMEQIRTQLKQMGDALMAPEGAPNNKETAAFAERTRQALNLFLEDDIPQELRLPVAELDDFARELPKSVHTWDGLRRHRAVAAAAHDAAQALREAERSLHHEMQAIDGLVKVESPAARLRVGEALRQIPPSDVLDMHLANLDGILSRADSAVAEARLVTGRAAALPPLEASSISVLLQKRLEQEIERSVALVKESKAKMESTFAAVDPLVGRGRTHAAALKRMSHWRAYTDLMARARGLAQRVSNAGAAGIQAFFIENETGRFGPFELEQKLTLGDRALVVRNPASATVIVLASDTSEKLAQDDTGAAVLPIRDPQGGETFDTTFELTGNCDEMAVQLDYVTRESEQLVNRTRDPLRAPPGWLGTFNEVLTRAGDAVRKDYENQRRTWEKLRDDLRSLRPFKERLATFRLLQRMGENVAAMLQTARQARKQLDDATARVSAIVAACNTDLETGMLHIPQKYKQEYPDQLARRDGAKATLAAVAKRAQRAIDEIKARLHNPELRGAADFPALEVLGGLPEAWRKLVEPMSDDSIVRRLRELQGPLRTPLKPDGWPPAPVAAERLARPLSPGAGGPAKSEVAAERFVAPQEVEGVKVEAAEGNPFGHLADQPVSDWADSSLVDEEVPPPPPIENGPGAR